MKLIENWRQELNRVWSAKLAILSALLLNMPDLLTTFQVFIEPRWFQIAATVAAIGAFLARFIQQKDPQQ